MLIWMLQITISSIILIFLVHHLINFFKSTLTVPKIKDLVNSPTQKYEHMFNIITHNEDTNLSLNQNIKSNTIKINTDELIPKPDTEKMKNELKNFFKEQMNTKTQNQTKDNSMNNMFSNIDYNSSMSTSIQMLDSGSSNGLSYSSF